MNKSKMNLLAIARKKLQPGGGGGRGRKSGEMGNEHWKTLKRYEWAPERKSLFLIQVPSGLSGNEPDQYSGRCRFDPWPHSGLRIRRCHELWCRLKMRLGSQFVCGCGVGWQLQLRCDPQPGNFHMLQVRP